MSLNLLASASHWIGLAIYGLILLAFGVDLALRRNRQDEALEKFRSLGPLLGLSMGALIFGGIGLHLIQYGLHWPNLGDAPGQRLVTKYGVFAVLWLSSFHLEIWTLEPLRQAKSSQEDPSPHIRAPARQVQVNAVLFLVVGALSLLHLP